MTRRKPPLVDNYWLSSGLFAAQRALRQAAPAAEATEVVAAAAAEVPAVAAAAAAPAATDDDDEDIDLFDGKCRFNWIVCDLNQRADLSGKHWLSA